MLIPWTVTKICLRCLWLSSLHPTCTLCFFIVGMLLIKQGDKDGSGDLLKSCDAETKNTRWFKVPFSSSNWRSLNPLKGSLNHPKKVTLNHQVCYIILSLASPQCMHHLVLGREQCGPRASQIQIDLKLFWFLGGGFIFFYNVHPELWGRFPTSW